MKANRMRELWKGPGAYAFWTRWTTLTHYVGGSDHSSDDGLMEFLKEQIRDMRQLAENADSFQYDCADAIEQHLAGLREKWVKLLVHPDEGGISDVVGVMADYGGTGAALGGAGGPKAQAIGGALGAVVGAVVGFMQSAEKQAQEYLNMRASGKEFTMSVLEMSRGLDVMDRDRYAHEKGEPKPGSFGENPYPNQDYSAGGKSKDDGAIDQPWE